MSPPELPDVLFHPDGDRFVPTELTRGPWDPNAMHGGAPAVLLARAIERFEPGPATHVARLTIDLLRPVPLVPLEVRTGFLRPGKKVQILESTIVADGIEVVRASALRLREAPLELPPGAETPVDDRMLPPGAPEVFEGRGDVTFGHAMDVSFESGTFDTPGPSRVWFRLGVPAVAGEEVTPLMRVAAAADFGNGISSSLDWNEGWTFINPDLTVYLHRLAVGEWIGLDAVTWADPRGVAVAEAGLFDVEGRIGRATQSLLLDRRG